MVRCAFTHVRVVDEPKTERSTNLSQSSPGLIRISRIRFPGSFGSHWASPNDTHHTTTNRTEQQDKGRRRPRAIHRIVRHRRRPVYVSASRLLIIHYKSFSESTYNVRLAHNPERAKSAPFVQHRTVHISTSRPSTGPPHRHKRAQRERLARFSPSSSPTNKSLTISVIVLLNRSSILPNKLSFDLLTSFVFVLSSSLHHIGLIQEVCSSPRVFQRS